MLWLSWNAWNVYCSNKQLQLLKYCTWSHGIAFIPALQPATRKGTAVLGSLPFKHDMTWEQFNESTNERMKGFGNAWNLWRYLTYNMEIGFMIFNKCKSSGDTKKLVSASIQAIWHNVFRQCCHPLDMRKRIIKDKAINKFAMLQASLARCLGQREQRIGMTHWNRRTRSSAQVVSFTLQCVYTKQKHIHANRS